MMNKIINNYQYERNHVINQTSLANKRNIISNETAIILFSRFFHRKINFQFTIETQSSKK